MLTAPPPGPARPAAPSDRTGVRGAGPAAATPPGRRAAARPVASRPAASVALAVLTVASAAGLFRVFAGHRWVGPVFATILVVQLVCWSLRRLGAGQVVSVPPVIAAIVLMACWTVLGRYTTFGVPTNSTWHHAVTALGDLNNEIASLTPPVQATTAFQLVAVGGAAVAGALGDWAAFRWRTPMLALVPALSAFIFCCTSGSGRGRGLVVAAEVAAICLFLMVERATGGDGLVWFAGIRTGVAAWVAAAGGIIMAAAVVAAVAVSPALARRDGTGVMGWRSGIGGNGGERIVPNPLVDLRTRLTQLSHDPVFIVESTVPSYWRLTSLDTFDGVTWISTGSYGGFSQRLPGAPPAGSSVRTVRATFDIQQLDSVWLPAQFDPITVQGAQHVTYDPGSNSLLTSKSTSNGLEYSVTSYQYLDTLSAATLETAPPLTRSSLVEQDVELPATVSPRVLTLAQTITAGDKTEYDKAISIQNYLRGPLFTYNLDPPSDGSGTNAIDTFLFQTRQGYCQQFAGAYAVLARAVGLPTRLAVGFAQGQPDGSGYQVHDGDYHTWPEVYFGPSFGWVPFEPTKGFSVPGSSGYANTGTTPTGPNVSTPTTVPTTVPGGNSSTSPTIGKQHGKTTPTTLAAPVSATPSGGVSPWWLAIPVAVLAWIGLTAGVPYLRRRARARRAARAGTGAVVLNAWSHIESELQWHGIERRPDETDDEFARRASQTLRRLNIEMQLTYGGLEGLAAMARRARFAPSVPDGLGEQASVTAREVHQKLAAVTARRRRIARLWSPPPGSWRKLVGLVQPSSRRRPAGGRVRPEAGG